MDYLELKPIIKKILTKYKFLIIILLVFSIPIPIINFFEDNQKLENTLKTLKEGEISTIEITSEIDTLIPNIMGIEYEKKVFPIILKREISVEEEVSRILNFLEKVKEQPNLNSKIKLIFFLPPSILSNILTRILEESIVLKRNKINESIAENSNIIVIYKTNIFYPKYIILLPTKSEKELEEAIETILGKLFIPSIKEGLIVLLNNTLIPNASFSEKLQEEEFKKYLIMRNIPTEIEIRKGQKIIEQGKEIRKENIETIKNYISQVKKRNFIKMILLEVMITILALFSVGIISIFKNIRHSKILTINTGLLLSSLYFQLFMKNIIGYTAILTSLFIAFLLINSLISGRKSTLVVSMFYSLVLLLIIPTKYVIVINWTVMILVLSIMNYRIKKRSEFIIIGTILVIVVLILYLIVNYVEYLEIGNIINYGMISFITVFSNVLLIFLILPVYEYFFRVATPFKLYELSSLDNPLLKELLKRAPGTYYHSLNVGILAEAAAEAIHANSLLAKVGALYHDIGKMENPNYFTENIGGKTREDIDPFRYTEIIKKHPIKGQELALQYRLPIEIERIIVEHHGNSVISYFYNKASKDNPNVDINFFRYKTPLPSSKESAIVFICDKIEARIRSLTSNQKISPDTLQSEIENTIYNQVIMGELSQSELTLKDLNDIKKALIENLNYILHQRIEYPK